MLRLDCCIARLFGAPSGMMMRSFTISFRRLRQCDLTQLTPNLLKRKRSKMRSPSLCDYDNCDEMATHPRGLGRAIRSRRLVFETHVNQPLPTIRHNESRASRRKASRRGDPLMRKSQEAEHLFDEKGRYIGEKGTWRIMRSVLGEGGIMAFLSLCVYRSWRMENHPLPCQEKAEAAGGCRPELADVVCRQPWARVMTCGGLFPVEGVNLMCQDTRKQTQEPRSQFKKIYPRH
ncbi:hypothetical protein V8C44DRAFT_79115 [Trichoderma aethiopicum]